MNTSINVSVKFFNIDQGFGFFKQQGAQDVFVHVADLTKYGFIKADMVIGTPSVIDFVETQKGLVVTKIHSIGAKKTPPTEIRSIVDRKGDLLIVKVTQIKSNCSHFEVRKNNIDGEKIGENIYRLADARKKIGRTIDHPQAPNFGQKTNVVRVVAPSNSNDNKKKDKKANRAA